MSSPAEPFREAVTIVHADVDGDIVQISATTWALHGFIAYDGEVLLAEFDDPAAARQALHRIPINPNSKKDTS